MADRDARLRDLQQQLHQLEMEAQGSALTPGEAQRNRDQRDVVLREMREFDGPAAPPASAPLASR